MLGASYRFSAAGAPLPPSPDPALWTQQESRFRNPMFLTACAQHCQASHRERQRDGRGSHGIAVATLRVEQRFEPGAHPSAARGCSRDTRRCNGTATRSPGRSDPTFPARHGLRRAASPSVARCGPHSPPSLHCPAELLRRMPGQQPGPQLHWSRRSGKVADCTAGHT